tara:strand:+ start:432 stop:821 length:390 start_codon:yes stop_codon:yes gene_type:complete
MSENFTVEIISPNATVFKSEANQVLIPSYEGEMGILKNHIPLITFLRPGLIKIFNNSEENFFVEEGTVEFASNSLLILTSTAKKINELDKTLITNLIKEAENKSTDEKISDKERYLLAYKIETLKNINR